MFSYTIKSWMNKFSIIFNEVEFAWTYVNMTNHQLHCLLCCWYIMVSECIVYIHVWHVNILHDLLRLIKGWSFNVGWSEFHIQRFINEISTVEALISSTSIYLISTWFQRVCACWAGAFLGLLAVPKCIFLAFCHPQGYLASAAHPYPIWRWVTPPGLSPV